MWEQKEAPEVKKTKLEGKEEDPKKMHQSKEFCLLYSFSEYIMPHTFIVDRNHRRYWIRLQWIFSGSG